MRNMRFSGNLTRLLADRGKTQADVAQAVGVDQASVSRWLAGRSMPRRQVLLKIADYFEVDAAELADGDVPSRTIVQEVAPTDHSRVAKSLRANAQRLREMADRLEQEAAVLEGQR